MARKTTRNYSGRQVDIELLHHIEGPTNRFELVFPDAFGLRGTARMASGVQKCVQRYAKLFLTGLGSVKSDPDLGSELLHDMAAGMVSDEADLNHLCSMASTSAVIAMSEDDSDGSFGDVPDDERLEYVELSPAEIDRSTGTARVSAAITTAAGESYEFVIPVASGLSAQTLRTA